MQLRHGLLRPQDHRHPARPHPHRRRHRRTCCTGCSGWPASPSAPAPTTARARAARARRAAPPRGRAAARTTCCHRPGPSSRRPSAPAGAAGGRPPPCGRAGPARPAAGSRYAPFTLSGVRDRAGGVGLRTGGSRASPASTSRTRDRCARSAHWLGPAADRASPCWSSARRSSPSSPSPRRSATCSRSGTSGSCGTSGGTLQVTRGLLTTRATSIERRRLVGVAAVASRCGCARSGRPGCSASPPGCASGAAPSAVARSLLPPAPLGGRRRGRRLACSTARPPSPPSCGRTGRPRGGAATCARCCPRRGRAPPPCSAGDGRTGLGARCRPASFCSPPGPLGLDRYAALGHALVDGALVTRTGSLVRRRSGARRDAVIGWNAARTFFQRRARADDADRHDRGGPPGLRRVRRRPARGAAHWPTRSRPRLLTEFRRSPRVSAPSHIAVSWSTTRARDMRSRPDSTASITSAEPPIRNSAVARARRRSARPSELSTAEPSMTRSA